MASCEARSDARRRFCLKPSVYLFFFCSFAFLETFRHLVREEVYSWRRAKWPRANWRSILALNGAFLPCISPRKNGDASRSRSWAAPSSSWAAAGRLLAARVRLNGSEQGRGQRALRGAGPAGSDFGDEVT